MTRYEALLSRLLPARRFGMVLGLERMRDLLDRLGAPDRRMGTIVHVGGTNGKGSTVAMIAALVVAGGKRVATYTSPHLSSLRERIAGAGQPIGEDEICDAADAVHEAGGDEFTFFEQLTAIACVAIAKWHVDVTVLEVGLGGRLDATNAIAADVAVVTGVAMDHAEILGTTLEAIAHEKAGIFHADQRLVVGASGEPSAVPTLVAAAHAVDATALSIVGEAAIANAPFVRLPGAHQRRNAAAALAAIDHLVALGALAITDEQRVTALATVVHPGRFEILRVGDREVILDGAHNEHGARALAAAVVEHGIWPTFVLAVSSEKDARGIVEALHGVGSRIVATRYQQARSMDPEILAQICGGRATTAPDLASALAAIPSGPIVIAGSLFLVGEARVLLLDAPVDPIVVSDPSKLG